MDEQKTQQPTLNEEVPSAEYDDMAREWGSDEDYADDYGEYYDTDDNYGGNIDDPDPSGISDTDESIPAGIEPDGARLASNGNVEFGKEFFGNVHETGKREPQAYTDDELRNTPYENWDMERLSGDVGRYAPIVQEQLARRQADNRAQTIESLPMPQDIQEVKPYTPHELSEEAMRLACEKLGLEDPEDFDDYEADHRAAMQLAMNELMEQRNADVAGYRRGQTEWGQLQKFNAELSRQPDFREFNDWYTSKLQEAGVTAEQVNEGLYSYARRNGNRFSVIPQIIGTWYSEFQRSRGNNGRGNYPQYDAQSSRYPRYDAQTSRYPQNSTQRASRPPVLEITRGNDYGGRRSMNLRDFGDMDSDEQASALMRMGLV